MDDFDYDVEYEPDEDEAALGRIMRELGFKVNYEKQEKIDLMECCIYYDNFKNELCSTESYILESAIVIYYHEKTGKSLKNRIKAMMQYIEREYVNSHLFDSATFKFGKIETNKLGTSYRAKIPCLVREEVDHG